MSVSISGYALFDSENNPIVWWVSVPNRLQLPNGTTVEGLVNGWNNGTYHVGAHTWTDVGAPVKVDMPTLLSYFTQSEQEAMITANDHEIWLYLFKAASAGAVLNDETFGTWLSLLITKEVVTAERAQQILAAVVQTT